MKATIALLLCFLTLLTSCSSTKGFKKNIVAHMEEFNDIKYYLFDNYYKKNVGTLLSHSDNHTLSYIFPEELYKTSISDDKLLHFCSRFNVHTIYLEGKENPDFHINDSVIVIEFKTTPYVEKCKSLIFDFNKEKSFNRKNVEVLSDGMLFQVSKPNTY